MENKTNSSNLGAVVAVRGSVVDIQFDGHLPPTRRLREMDGKPLTAELFDRMPLDQMNDAVRALGDATKEIPTDVCGRLDTAAKLSTEDRKAILAVAHEALARFQPKSEPEKKA